MADLRGSLKFRLFSWVLWLSDWNRRDNELLKRVVNWLVWSYQPGIKGASAQVIKRRTGAWWKDILINFWYEFWQLNYWFETKLFYPRHPIIAKTCRVRTKDEKIVANWLTDNGIRFKYEKRLRLGNKWVLPDFYLKGHGVYVEYWGLSGADDGYDKRKKEKLALYRKYRIKVISLYPNHLRRGKRTLDEVFPRLFEQAAGKSFPAKPRKEVSGKEK